MLDSRKERIFIVLITLYGILTAYLFQLHLSFAGKAGAVPDICSTVFGKGCENALKSGIANFAGLSLAGWGLIYFFILSLLFLFYKFGDPLLKKGALGLLKVCNALGALVSIGLIGYMLLNPSELCPVCLISHLVNLAILILLSSKRRTSDVYNQDSYLKKDGIGGIIKRNWSSLVLGFGIVLLFTISTYLLLSIVEERFGVANQQQAIEKAINEYQNGTSKVIPILADDNSKGKTDALLQIVVFSDYQCPSCRYFHQILDSLEKLYPGQFRIVYKHFPLSTDCNPVLTKNIHPLSCLAAQAAEAAGKQGKFLEYQNELFKNMYLDKDKTYFTLAKRLKLNLSEFKSGLSDPAIEQKIARNIREGRHLNISGTPAVFINQKQVSDIRLESLEGLIKSILKNDRPKSIEIGLSFPMQQNIGLKSET